MNSEQKQHPSTNGVHVQEPIQRRPLEGTPQQRADNRHTLGMVLTIMGSMAILGLLFMLWTVPLRRANDRQPAQSVPETMLHKQ